MARTIIKTFSVNLTKLMHHQLEFLKNKFGENAGQVISRALERIYRDDYRDEAIDKIRNKE